MLELQLKQYMHMCVWCMWIYFYVSSYIHNRYERKRERKRKGRRQRGERQTQRERLSNLKLLFYQYYQRNDYLFLCGSVKNFLLSNNLLSYICLQHSVKNWKMQPTGPCSNSPSKKLNWCHGFKLTIKIPERHHMTSC